MISAPSFIVLVHGGVVEIISSGGKQKIENNPPSSYKNPYNRAAVLPRGRNIQDMMPMPWTYHHSYSSSQYGSRRHQMATSQIDIHTRWGAFPDHMWIYPRWYKIPTTQVDVVEESHAG